MGGNADAVCGREKFTEQFEALRSQFCSRARYARDVSARPRQTGDQAGRHGIAGRRHDDWNITRRATRRRDDWDQRGDNNIDLAANHLGGQFRKSASLPLRGPNLDLDILALDIAEIAHRLRERPHQLRGRRGEARQHVAFFAARAPRAATAQTPRPAVRGTRGVSFEAFPSGYLHAEDRSRLADTLPRPTRNRNAVLLALGADRVAALARQHDLVGSVGAGEAGNRGPEPLGFA
jgi:hypothetical protein